MRRRTTFAIVSTLSLLCCASMPKKPSVALCQLDLPRDEAACAQTQTQDPPFRKPIAAFDKATAFVPGDWEKMQTYIDKLEQYAKELEQDLARCASE